MYESRIDSHVLQRRQSLKQSLGKLGEGIPVEPPRRAAIEFAKSRKTRYVREDVFVSMGNGRDVRVRLYTYLVLHAFRQAQQNPPGECRMPRENREMRYHTHPPQRGSRGADANLARTTDRSGKWPTGEEFKKRIRVR